MGCGKKAAAVQYCNGGDSGPVVGQLSSVELSPSLAVQGESLNYGQIGQGLSATGLDCKGSVVSLSGTVYASTDMSFADINPGTGQVCGGTWNRHTSGGIADYTLCTAPSLTTAQQSQQHLAYLTATADGITSNAVPVYVHAQITGIVLGVSSTAPLASRCSLDPDTTCCPADPNTVKTGITLYDGVSCVSQSQVQQLAARVYINNDPGNLPTSGANNITCNAGHLNFAAQNGSIASLDQNGVITSLTPGSTTISASLANSSSASNIGFFSACPPKTITITPVGNAGSSTISVPLNNSQPFTTTVTDTLGNPITGLAFTFLSSNPQIVPLSSGTAVPAFPGTATITALCQPPSCNPAPTDQLGLNGNGKPVTSNGVTINATGTSSTAIYVASTDSRYILPYDFSTGLPGSIVKLQYPPNSMVISLDGSTVYFGSSFGIMSLNTSSNVASAANTLIPGQIVGISPDGGTLVVTDPLRQTISLVSGGATVTTTLGGVATHAAFSADSSTVYITTAPVAGGTTNSGYILNHSSNSNWQKTPITGNSGGPTGLATTNTDYVDVTALVPSVGAYFAGAKSTDGRSYCPTTTIANNAVNPPVTANVFTPLADVKAKVTDRVAATTDTKHVLGANSVATAGGTPYFTDITLGTVTGVCTANTNNTQRVEPPIAFSTTAASYNFAGVTPTTITGVVPANNSAVAFVTFQGTGNGKVPYYFPSTAALNYLTLSTALGTPTAPVAGVFSTDNLTFYLGTDGDKAVHLINLTYPTSGVPTLVDGTPLNPLLPSETITNGYATPNLIVQRPRHPKS